MDGRGSWHLLKAMDWLEEATARTRWLGRPFKWKDRTKSTQDDARQWLLNGAPHGAIVLAGYQTKGRGRMGRSWFSPALENLYMTLILRLPPTAPLGTLGLFIAVRSALALRTRLRLPVMVKWPNDLMAEGKKLGGILVEVTQEKGAMWALVGIGINVNVREQDFPEELRPIATSLQIVSGKQLDRGEVLKALLLSIEEGWSHWEKGKAESFWQDFQNLDFLRGRSVQVLLPDGRLVEGVASGITKDGQLILQTADGTTLYVHAGEAHLKK
ncbi:MAG: biotin--[acetyl-CoA-carboxylase] ligase [Armatimonadetes bacterium]|nr:biotin--[acetyl-CoA-carboxylase] ligase [Armatimonadota bacterium]MDW8121143.1 biotin--[acetyl-CoA-carboxylase] ligase [Armatimonadota bacterium]